MYIVQPMLIQYNMGVTRPDTKYKQHIHSQRPLSQSCMYSQRPLLSKLHVRCNIFFLSHYKPSASTACSTTRANVHHLIVLHSGLYGSKEILHHTRLIYLHHFRPQHASWKLPWARASAHHFRHEPTRRIWDALDGSRTIVSLLLSCLPAAMALPPWLHFWLQH